MNKFLLLDKEHGLSSFKCIYPLKKNFKKVGHTGTLDPFATGLLVVAIGRATKFIQYLPDTKEYVFSIQFGLRTDSDDLDGRIIEQNDFIPKHDEILKILPSFIGVIKQVPSRFSAIKINGERAYKLARSLVVFDVPSREIMVDALDLLSFNHGVASFRVVCHKGTYVRSLSFDICSALGVIGCVTKLHRISSNGFSLGDITEYELDCFMNFYECVILDDELIFKVKNGAVFFFCFPDGVYCLLDSGSLFYGLIKIENNFVYNLCLI